MIHFEVHSHQDKNNNCKKNQRIDKILKVINELHK